MTGSDWFWAAIIVAIPFVLFGIFELAGMLRHRRAKAIAQRPKGPRASRR